MGVTGVQDQSTAEAWEAYVGTDPTDNIFPRHALLEALRENGSFQEEHGRVIRHNLEYAQNTNVAWITEYGTVSIAPQDTFTNDEFVWKNIACAVPMSDQEAGISEGSAGKFDVKARKLQNMKNSVEDATNVAFFGDGTSFGGLSVGGLQLLVSNTPTTGTVGGIPRSTYTFFRNQVKDATKTTTKYDNLISSMTNVYNSCSNGVGSQNPTFAIGTQNNFEGFETVQATKERLVRETSGDKLLANYKGQNIQFKDIPLVYDPACPAGNLYILNNRNLFFVYMQWMKGEDPIRPADAFYNVFKVLSMGNMTTDNPRRLGVVINTEL